MRIENGVSETDHRLCNKSSHWAVTSTGNSKRADEKYLHQTSKRFVIILQVPYQVVATIKCFVALLLEEAKNCKNCGLPN